MGHLNLKTETATAPTAHTSQGGFEDHVAKGAPRALYFLFDSVCLQVILMVRGT